MKKLYTVLFFLLLILLPQNALAADAESHAGHDATLAKLCIGAQNDMDFCGEFFCNDCGVAYYNSVTCEDVGMPILNIMDGGDLDKVTKENKLNFPVSYTSSEQSFTCVATFKWQGSTSTEFPKKNYSIQFFKDDTLEKKQKVELADGWGEQSKFCLKANWVDFSQSRNIVSGRIFSEIVHSRGKDDALDALPNGGAVDGFPVLVYRDGVFYGLFTLNIPKDKWMFGMDDETLRQALLFADNWKKSPKLLTAISNVNDVSTSGWDMEYCSTEDDPAVGIAWPAELMNDFISFLNSRNSDFRKDLSDYVDVDRAIDVMLFTYFIYGTDNAAKNIVWACYDGKTWIPSVYDMDGTWGMKWDGSFFNNAGTAFTPEETSTTSKINPTNYFVAEQYNAGGGNMLFLRLLENYSGELTARYTELRESILTKAHLNAAFDSFFAQIPDFAYDAERAMWPDAPSNSSNTLHPEQIRRVIDQRIACLDKYFGVQITERPDGLHLSGSARREGDTLMLDCTLYNGTNEKKDLFLCAAAYDPVSGRQLSTVSLSAVCPAGRQLLRTTLSLPASRTATWKLFLFDGETCVPLQAAQNGTA